MMDLGSFLCKGFFAQMHHVVKDNELSRLEQAYFNLPSFTKLKVQLLIRSHCLRRAWLHNPLSHFRAGAPSLQLRAMAAAASEATEAISPSASSSTDSAPADRCSNERCRQLLLSERAGRTKAERQLRDLLNGQTFGGKSSRTRDALESAGSGEVTAAGAAATAVSAPPAPSASTFPCFTIGRVRSCFPDRRGAPRQGLLVPDARSYILFDKLINPASFEGLEEYSHAYLLFVFHENSNEPARLQRAAEGKGFTAKIAPPMLGGKKVGVFATRTPHRPNPIGLSLVRVHGLRTIPVAALRQKFFSVDAEGVAGAGGAGGSGDGGKTTQVLVVSGSDLLSGTPILDVKPFHPADCARCFHEENRARRRGAAGAGEAAPAACNASCSCSSCACCGEKKVESADSVGRESEPSLAAAGAAGDGKDSAANLAAAVEQKASLSEGAAAADQSSAPDLIHVPLELQEDWFQPSYPGWCNDTFFDNEKRLPVCFTPAALSSLRSLCKTGQCFLYQGGSEQEADALLRAVVQTLSLDIRSVPQGKGGLPRPEHSVSSEKAVTLLKELEEKEREAAASTSVAAAAAASSSSSTSSPPPSAPPLRQTYELFFDSLYILFSFVSEGAVSAAGGVEERKLGEEVEEEEQESAAEEVYIRVESVTLA